MNGKCSGLSTGVSQIKLQILLLIVASGTKVNREKVGLCQAGMQCYIILFKIRQFEDV